jgi:hypothetical protein
MMNPIELVTLKEPQRFYDWMNNDRERIRFLKDIMFTLREQYPDTELIFSLDPTDDDTVIVEPYGSEPYQFRVSEYRAIEETLQPYRSGVNYREFVRRYTDWCSQFQAWWNSYCDYMIRLRRTVYQERESK